MGHTHEPRVGILRAIGVIALALVATATPSLGQNDVEALKKEVERKLSNLEKVLTPPPRQEETLMTRKLKDLSATVSKVSREADEADRRVPAKRVIAPAAPPVVYELEDSFDRLRRNQKALTEQRIGDIIILQGNR